MPGSVRKSSNSSSSHRVRNRNLQIGLNVRYMIVERFRNGNPVPVYSRAREYGRLAPEGLKYVDSWVSADLTLCFQVMECEDAALIDQWVERWHDLVDFEVYPIISSAKAAEIVLESS